MDVNRPQRGIINIGVAILERMQNSNTDLQAPENPAGSEDDTRGSPFTSADKGLYTLSPLSAFESKSRNQA
jgi:hypothetical protein